MDMRHRVPLLLVACLVELPLVDVVQLTLQVHLVVLHDLLGTALRVAHYVEELVEEDVGVKILALF